MDQDEQILLCAFRYAYGRRSYIVRVVKDYISERLGTLGRSFLELVLQEFEYFSIDEHGGDNCDKKQWLNLKQEIDEELESRDRNR